MLHHLLESLQRRFVAAMVVGLLIFGVPTVRAATFRVPPAVVRVQAGPSAGAVAWQEFFGPLRAEVN